MFEDAESEEEEVETTPLSSCRGAFMDLLDVSLVLLEEQPIEEALFLWTSGDPSSGRCVIFVLLHNEPEHLIFLHFLDSSMAASCSFCCFCGGCLPSCCSS